LPIAGAALAVGGAAFCGVAVAGLIAWSGPVDAPRARGGHDRPTPTSGGLAIIAATALGLAILIMTRTGASDARIAWLTLIAIAAGLLGAGDDMFDLRPTLKLAIQIGLALVFAIWVSRPDSLPIAPGVTLPLPAPISVLGVALWMVVLTNAVNFLDGADGLSPCVVVIALIGLVVAAGLHGQTALALVALVGAAAGLGFLPWNLPAHRLFQGDAGALFSGVFLAGLAVLATDPAQGQPLSPYMVVFAGLPMLTDVLLTLAARARERKPLFHAHREHLYQRWLQGDGRTHASLAWRFWAITAVFTGAGAAAEQAPMEWRGAIFAAGCLTSVVGWIWLRPRVP
jgi:UDP-GlcNAc:undecaprenyl-phosphate GlcNAc-1-phosphate transferase